MPLLTFNYQIDGIRKIEGGFGGSRALRFWLVLETEGLLVKDTWFVSKDSLLVSREHRFL